MMIKIDTSPMPLTYSTHSQKDLETTRRLIVLVPANIDFSTAPQRIWAIAHASGMNIQLLGLSKDRKEESGLRRGLIAMAALLQDSGICVEAKVDIGTNWVEALRSNYKVGDMIVCFAEQRTGLLQKPLSQILESNFQATVYILSGLTSQKSGSNRLLQIRTWLGSIAIIVAFGIVQAKIVQFPEGALQTMLLILSLIPELWLIWISDAHFR